MSLDTLTKADQSTSSLTGDEVDHWFCQCSPNLSLCGLDITGMDTLPDDEELPFPCIVCDDLLCSPCLKCGQD